MSSRIARLYDEDEQVLRQVEKKFVATQKGHDIRFAFSAAGALMFWCQIHNPPKEGQFTLPKSKCFKAAHAKLAKGLGLRFNPTALKKESSA